MRVKQLIVGATVAGTAALSACATGTGTPVASPDRVAAQSSATTTTTTTTAAPTTTTTTAAPTTTTTTTTSKTTTAKPKPAAAPVATGGTPCTISDGACVSISMKKSWLLAGGKVIYGPVPITSGRSGFRTPTGMFHVLYKDIDHKSKEFNDAPMPYSVFFFPGDAFHSGSLSVASHGCIHLSTAAAKMYFNTLHVGQAVQVLP
jgi:lipoprotein-anchoring transpeptidase ErfK/SrfK